MLDMAKYDRVCSFFGHRTIQDKENLIVSLKVEIENLIVNRNVDTFLFGSKSEFDTLCHCVVTELMEKYSYIQRIAYTCKSESCTLESQRTYWETLYSNTTKEKITLLGVEKEYQYKNKWKSGKASYVERNQAMIDDSYYCIFYYNENYQPQRRDHHKHRFDIHQPKSGTSLAYTYAKQKKKHIIRIGCT